MCTAWCRCSRTWGTRVQRCHQQVSACCTTAACLRCPASQGNEAEAHLQRTAISGFVLCGTVEGENAAAQPQSRRTSRRAFTRQQAALQVRSVAGRAGSACLHRDAAARAPNSYAGQAGAVSSTSDAVLVFLDRGAGGDCRAGQGCTLADNSLAQ